MHMKRPKKFFAAVVLLVLLAGCQVKPDAPSLWQYLAIPQTAGRLRDNLINRRGRLPGLERKPMLRSIADPANLLSNAKVIAVAAKVKQSEDQAKQKIKAIRYLAKVGCACYDSDGSVTEALVAALSDCTEKVRLAAAQAIADSAKDESCDECRQQGCCSRDLRKKLSELAYQTDDDGYWVEPSERVRKAAELALSRCGGAPVDIDPDQPRPPDEVTQQDATDIEMLIRTAEKRQIQAEPQAIQPEPQPSDAADVDRAPRDADEFLAADEPPAPGGFPAVSAHTVPPLETPPSVASENEGDWVDGSRDQGAAEKPLRVLPAGDSR